MSVATAERADAVLAGAADILPEIARPDVALTLWQRSVPDALVPLLAALDLDGIDDLHATLGDGGDAGMIAPVLVDAGYPDALAAALADDIAMLAGRHRAVLGEHPALRLEVVETDACRRFHADYVTVRLICTYVGRGTQWCPAANPDDMAELSAGTVALFKGRMLLDPPAVLHRSPPIADEAGQRLVLVLDPSAK